MAKAHRQAAVIGAGAVGTALGQRLVECGYSVEGVVSRTREDAERLAAQLGSGVASDDVADLPSVSLLFCCVPDDAVAAVATALAEQRTSWHGRLVAHTSGALTAEALAPLAARDAFTLSFHPMQTFAPGAGADAFEGVTVGLEGSPAAVAMGRQVAASLKLAAVEVPAEAKVRYHLAASVASNFFVTLMALADEVLASAGLEEDEAQRLLAPLVESTWRNVQATSPAEALTGPVARGDRETVVRHLEALERALPHLRPAYGVLAAETVRLARRSGRLSEQQADALLVEIKEAVEKGAA